MVVAIFQQTAWQYYYMLIKKKLDFFLTTNRLIPLMLSTLLAHQGDPLNARESIKFSMMYMAVTHCLGIKKTMKVKKSKECHKVTC